MKKIMLVGRQSCGKTSLCQALVGEELFYKKTQVIEFISDNTMIDTPGEYLEQKHFYKALMVTSVEADLILFLVNPLDTDNLFAPGFSTMFNKPCIGIITKSDLASGKQIAQAKHYLTLAYVKEIFITSSVTTEGIQELSAYLNE